jgi:hypothetical protein
MKQTFRETRRSSFLRENNFCSFCSFLLFSEMLSLENLSSDERLQTAKDIFEKQDEDEKMEEEQQPPPSSGEKRKLSDSISIELDPGEVSTFKVDLYLVKVLIRK